MTQALKEILKPIGGNTGLARKLRERGHSITPQAISQWEKIPAERAKEISEVTGIPLHDLREDLWPRPDVDAAQ